MSRPRPTTKGCENTACRRQFRVGSTGRPAQYCSPACRAAAYRERGGPKQHRLVTLIEGDAQTLLRDLPDGAIDLIVTDPPYVFDRGSTYFRTWFAELPDDAWPEIFAQLYRVLSDNSDAYVFCDGRVKPHFDEAAARAGFRLRSALIWDKLSVGLGAGWRAQYEHIAWYQKGRPLHARNDLGNVRGAARPRGYPTEKPVPLIRELIMQSSAPGQTVLDPFCGSGSVGRAARSLGRRAVLTDVDTATAKRRLRVRPFRDATAS